ncbi:unannotated protein [freshwater metagenome]|uniref:Unannotated protein n=1 Tax=freshwater metagenome TaxID=449393 RepID=A0A6J7LT39_9ZZZZ
MGAVTGDLLIGVGDEVPFADAVGGITARLQDLGNSGGSGRDATAGTRIALVDIGEFLHAHRVAVASREQRGARR